jgi:hypothetical protein
MGGTRKNIAGCCRHRCERRGAVRGQGAIGALPPRHDLRTRRAARHSGASRRRAAGQTRAPADGAGRRGMRRALPRTARRYGGRRRTDAGEPARLHPFRRGGSRPFPMSRSGTRASPNLCSPLPRNGSAACDLRPATTTTPYRPIWWSTPPDAERVCRCGCSSGGLSAHPRRASMSGWVRHPAGPHPGRAHRREGGGGRRLP